MAAQSLEFAPSTTVSGLGGTIPNQEVETEDPAQAHPQLHTNPRSADYRRRSSPSIPVYLYLSIYFYITFYINL